MLADDCMRRLRGETGDTCAPDMNRLSVDIVIGLVSTGVVLQVSFCMWELLGCGDIGWPSNG